MNASMTSSIAGSLALKTTKGANPTVRLDKFLRDTDPGYQHAEVRTQGDHFIRKMATYGHMRPSVSFTSESRVARPVNVHSAMDMSNLPPPWMDPRGDEKEGTFSFAPPPTDINNDYITCYKNHSLMMPSERRREHEYMKEAEQKWRQDRKDAFMYGKRMKLLDREHQNGIVGIDSPMLPDTKLYAQRRQYFLMQEDLHAQHANARHELLQDKAAAQDATACRQYGEPHITGRSQEIPMARKHCDAKQHPHRYLDTHSRLFPQHAPTWDPERAKVIRSHDVRDKRHNIVNQADATLEFKVAPNFEMGSTDLLSRSVPGRASHMPAADIPYGAPKPAVLASEGRYEASRHSSVPASARSGRSDAGGGSGVGPSQDFLRMASVSGSAS